MYSRDLISSNFVAGRRVPTTEAYVLTQAVDCIVMIVNYPFAHNSRYLILLLQSLKTAVALPGGKISISSPLQGKGGALSMELYVMERHSSFRTSFIS